MPSRKTKNNKLQNELRSLFNRAKLPTNPAIAVEILNLVNDPESTAEQFAEVIQGDMALAARLMKMSNSAHFTTRNSVTTIRRAVTVLGLRRIRMTAVSFQLVAHLDRLGSVPFDLQEFWQGSVLRACLTRELARQVVPGLAEEAFLVGLLQDSGILLMAQIFGKEYAQVYREERSSPTAFFMRERKTFTYNHVDVIEEMSREWRLPEPVARPLISHHTITHLGGQSDELERLCAISYFVGSLPIRGDRGHGKTRAKLMAYAEQELKITPDMMDAIFQAATSAYEQVAELFSEVLPEDIDVTDLLVEANHQLNLVASDATERTWEVEAERDKIREESMTLKNAVAQYREKAARDPLTGLLNRGALIDIAVSFVRESEIAGTSLSVFFIDIDNFKRLNDEKGHQTGDQVLCRVASVISGELPNHGAVGRYGGEEFVIIYSGLSQEQAREEADRIVRVVREQDHSDLQLDRQVTISLGAIWCAAYPSIEPLIKRADQLMYEAKRSGKDRFVIGVNHGNSSQDLKNLPAETRKGSRAIRSMTGQSGEDESSRLQQLAALLNGNENASFDSTRKQERHYVVLPCQFCFLSGPDLRVCIENACVRTLAIGGIGFLCNRSIVRGDLVEIAFPQKDGTIYAVGLVAFCRHIEGDVHEVGIQVISNDRKPIISKDPVRAMEKTNWIARIINDKYGSDLDVRKSA